MDCIVREVEVVAYRQQRSSVVASVARIKVRRLEGCRMTSQQWRQKNSAQVEMGREREENYTLEGILSVHEGVEEGEQLAVKPLWW
jgi:hypothetical protein